MTSPYIKKNGTPKRFSKAARFRKLLKKRGPVLLAGAHDAMSAKLIEEAGFDAVWASSFGISASTRCLPDANVLTMTEALEAAKGMNEAVSIPVIADCDNGYGNALNVIRMVREYERAGLAGISIEDNPFPKKCSLYPGERPELVDIDEMAGRIHAAKSTQESADFFVIARTEALIAGLGMEEALARARAYEEAGADAILVHSRLSTPREIQIFAGRWKGRVPLAVVPTKYPNVTAPRLGRMGIRIVIFANQALRASIRAMRETLGRIRRAESAGPVSGTIAPLDDVFRLVGQPMHEENEKTFVRNYRRPPAAVIVAAGFERNLWPLNSDRPRAMLEIKGRTILERQIEILKKAGVGEVAVVSGYKQEKINLPGIRLYRNPRYLKTHTLHSLFCAEAEMQDKFLFLYGDVLFEEEVLAKLLGASGDVRLVVDRPGSPEGLPAGQAGPAGAPKQRDWVLLRGDEVASIGQSIPRQKANGEFVGLAFFSKKGAAALRKRYHAVLKRNGHSAFHDAPSFEKAQFTDLMQELIDRGEKVSAVGVRGGWIEIDNFADYQRAWSEAR